MRGVQRKRRALQRVAAAGLTLARGDLGGERHDRRLRLAGDEPVEGRARIVEVVRAHRDVVAAGGDHGVRQLPPHPLGDGDGGRVLQRGPARDDHQVRLALGEQAVGDLQKALPRRVVARVAELGLEVEDVGVEARAAHLAEELDELRLDARSVRPATAVQRAGEHQQHARVLQSPSDHAQPRERAVAANATQVMDAKIDCENAVGDCVARRSPVACIAPSSHALTHARQPRQHSGCLRWA